MISITARPGYLHLTLMLCLVVIAAAAQADWEFEHQVVHVGLSRPDDIVHADIDGDGLMDLVVGEDAGMSWFKNLGGRQPSWQRHNPIDKSTTSKWMGTWVGDFDGDGDTDVCSSNKQEERGYWFENKNGKGTEWAAFVLPYSGDEADHSRTYDFNNDGRDDIVMQKYHGAGLFYMPSPSNPKGPWPAYKIGTGRAGVNLYDVDRDGDMDVLIENKWLENPGNPAQDNWPVHAVPNSRSRVKNAAGDINGDGQTDFAHAEEEGDECYVILSPTWERVTLKSDGNALHTMKLEDFDKDGDLDVVTGDIHGGRVYLYENADGQGTSWVPHNLPTWSNQGSHNCWVGDLNGDRMPDVFGKHYLTGSALEIWYNTFNQDLSLDRWTYKQISDSARRSFGLVLGDLNDDGFGDVAVGRYVYLNPRGDMTGTWQQVDLGVPDAMLIVDVDGDNCADIIGNGGSDGLFWWEANDTSATAWTRRTVGASPIEHNLSTQAYTLGQVVTGGRPEIILGAGNDAIYYWEIPTDNPEGGNWPRTEVAAAGTAMHEGVAAGDIDRDGDVDIVGHKDASLCWWENPADGSGNWAKHLLGEVTAGVIADRVDVADLDGDGRLDVVVGLEGPWGSQAERDIFVFEQPADAFSTDWPRHTAATLDGRSNSLDVADMDHDGDIDIICGTENGAMEVVVLENAGGFDFIRHTVATGYENHIGTQVLDLDGDSDLDVVSHGWRAYESMNLWRNDSVMRGIKNDPPLVDAGEDQAISLLQAAYLDGIATDDGRPLTDPCDPCSPAIGLTTEWSKLAGPGDVSFDDSYAVNTMATFAEPGIYELRLRAYDGQLFGHDDVLITVRIPGDIDGDSSVDIVDLHLLAEHWLQAGCGFGDDWCEGADLNSDGTVDMFDFAHLSVYWTGPRDPSAEGLVAHWKFDDGAGMVAVDSVGGHHGTLRNGPVWTPPGDFKIGTGALNFDGVDDLVAVEPFDVPGGGITLAAWIKPDDFDINDGRIISKATEWGGDDHWWMLSTIDTNHVLRFRLKTNDGSETTTLIADSGQLEAGRWAHVAATWDSTMMRLYKNAEQVGSTAKAGTRVAADPTVKVAIGSQPADAYLSDPSHVVKFFDGTIDDVRVYKRALSEDEIRALANR
jgi:hypothetical protein